MQKSKKSQLNFMPLNKLKQKALENNNQHYLKLSNMLNDQKQKNFYHNRLKFIRNHSDFTFLQEIEQYINLPANDLKVKIFENFIKNNQIFADFESLKQHIKQKKDVLQIEKNKYFLKFNTFDLNNIFKNSKIPNSICFEVETLILKMFNFLANKISEKYLSKMILSLGTTSNSKFNNTTYYFSTTGSIGMILIEKWWDREIHAAKQWGCVNKNGTVFIHEFGHVIDFFSAIQKSNFFLVNSLNVEAIYKASKEKKWKYSQPITIADLIDINIELRDSNIVLNDNPQNSLSFKFADYIFEKTIELLNRNKQDISQNYRYNNQPINLYYMIICALIPSNYVRYSIITSKFLSNKDVDSGKSELFAEAFSFLITADDQDKNIFWEWTYDFMTQKLWWDHLSD